MRTVARAATATLRRASQRRRMDQKRPASCLGNDAGLAPASLLPASETPGAAGVATGRGAVPAITVD
jgi:hypothetical protein